MKLVVTMSIVWSVCSVPFTLSSQQGAEKRITELSQICTQQTTKENRGKAYIELGDIYFYGKGVPKNYTLALRYYEIGSTDFLPEGLLQEYADFQRGQIHFFGGHGTTANKQTAKEMFEELVKETKNEALKTFAQALLADIYYYGDRADGTGKKDWSVAAHLYRAIAKATHDDGLRTQAYMHIGTIYFKGGHGMPQQWHEAKTNFKRALKHPNYLSAKDRAHANLWLGHTYFFAEHGSTNIQPRKAREHYAQVLKIRGASPHAQQQAEYYLAYAEYVAPDVRQDYQKLAERFRAAVVGADPQTLFSSHLALGDLYASGKIKSSHAYADAKKHFDVVADQQVYPSYRAQAAFALGHIYRVGGWGVERDLARARAYYTDAREQTANQPIANIAAAELAKLDRYEKFKKAQALDDDMPS